MIDKTYNCPAILIGRTRLMKKYILDLGSSTPKLYEFDGKSLSLQNQSSIHFKKQLENGVLADAALNELQRFIESKNLPCQDLRNPNHETTPI